MKDVRWSARGAVLHPKLAFVVAGVASFLLVIPIVAVVVLSGVVPFLTLVFNALLFGAMGLSYGFRSTKGAKSTAGTLSVDARGLALDGRLLARREELVQGFVVPTAAGTLVRFERRGLTPSLFVRVEDEADGEALLASLGFDAARTAAEHRIASGLLGMSVGMQLGIMLPPIALAVGAILTVAATFRAQAGPFVFALVVMLLAWTLGLSFAPMRVRVGTDGLVTRWLGRERFHPFAEIERVETYDEYVASKQQRGVRLTLTSGEVVKLPTGQTDIGSLEAASLAARIDEARRARKAGATAAASSLIARGSRPLGEWMRALRRAGAGAHDLRSSAVPVDALLRLVEDASASALDRAGAAVAALSTRDPEVRRRVRVAAETTASPRLRVALDRMTKGEVEDAELEGALEELAREGAEAR